MGVITGFSGMQMNTISFGLNSLLDIDPLELALSALKESKVKSPCILSSNTDNAQLVGNKRYIVIQDFD